MILRRPGCLNNYLFNLFKRASHRSQWPRSLKRRSAAARLLRLWVRIPPGARMSVCCKCCVLSGRGLCDELITRPEEYYRLWWVVLCDLETSWRKRLWPTGSVAPKINYEQVTDFCEYGPHFEIGVWFFNGYLWVITSWQWSTSYYSKQKDS